MATRSRIYKPTRLFYKLSHMNGSNKIILSVLCFLFAFQAVAQPRQIVIIRHGEKTEPSNEVNVQGCERAYSLPSFFLDNSIVEQYGRPLAIYAMKPDSATGSVRPIQTIAPTANLLQLPIRASYTREQYAPIVQEVMSTSAYQGGTVLIAWEHDAIPGLAEAFGVTLAASQTTWPDKVFDEAWVIDLTNPMSLQIIPEQALSTDNPLGGSDWQNGPTSTNPPIISHTLAKRCENNHALNILVQKWVTPAL